MRTIAVGWGPQKRPQSDWRLSTMRRRQQTARVILQLCVLLFPPGIAAPTELRLSDDAYVSSVRSNSNFGGSATLAVQSPANSTYIRFDLGSALPDGVTAADVSRAELRLFMSAVNHPGLLDVRLVSSPWSEETITFNHVPVAGALVIGAVAIEASSKFVDIDITDAVTAWLSGTPNDGIVLSPTAGQSISVTFDSKENTLTGHNPELY